MNPNTSPMNKRIHLVLTPLEREAVATAVSESQQRGFPITEAQALHAYLAVGIHQLNQLASKQPAKGVSKQ
jgi:hypothetical protein